jgi:iron complex outermembrane recepter protein
MQRFIAHPNAIAAALSLLAQAAAAQSTPPPATQSVVITGNPLRQADVAQPTTVLGGDALAARRAATLGDTLDGLPGVAGTGFGPNSSRPVIRGLDGDRVRMLDNGGSAVDASNLSFDHAVALDPLVAERIEVLRGPAALLYGGNATGGVVNLIDHRIPRAVLPLGGRVELRAGGADAQRGGAAVLEGGVPDAPGAAGGWAWHADVFSRRSSDLRVPRYVPLEDGAPLPASTRVRNSEGETSGGAVGASWLDGRGGRIGAALDGLRNDYGVTVEPDVTIRMKRERAALAAEWPLAGPFDQLAVTGGHTHYRHQEVEGTGEVGTTFESRGSDLRLELRQVARDGWRGVLGTQFEAMRFSALGEEAFVPGTHTRSAALFTLQSLDVGPWTLSAGLRGERVRVRSDGDAADAAEPRFGAARARSFDPLSASLAAQWKLDADWSASVSLGHTERAPAYYELYADGVHVATAAYERGDPGLGVERSRHAELGLRWSQGGHELKAQAYATRFSRYLSLDATGAAVPVTAEDGSIEDVPEYAFRAVRARMHGFELEGRLRALEGPLRLDVLASLDAVRGTNADTGEPLPRLSPLRAMLGLAFTQGAFDGGVELRHLAAQRRVPATDVATPSATLLAARVGWRQTLAGNDLLWMLRLDNLTNELAWRATALPTVRALSPMAGRSATLSAQLRF